MLPSRGLLQRGTLAATAARWASSPSSSVARRSPRDTSATTSRQPTHNLCPPSSAAEKREADAGEGATAPSPAAHAAAEKDVDEVERLLTVTATRAAPASPTPSTQTPTPMLASSLLSITGATTAAPDTIVDPGAALHSKALHQAEVSTRGRDRPTHVQLEQIDRRRSKPSLSEAEFGVGMTERLLPELPRLPALHEVHYGDAVVRELDRSTYFALKQGSSTSAATPSMSAGAGHPSTDTAAAPGNAAVVVINGEACVEMSLDEDLSEASFAAFDAEAGKAAPRATTPARTVAAAAAALCVKEDIDATDAPASGHSNGDATDAEEDGLSLQLNFGAERPWFVPTSGVVQLHPLSPQDCALLLRFVLRLRQQTEVDLVPSLRRALIAAEQRTAETGAGGEGRARRGGASVMSEPPQASLSSEPATGSRGRRPHLTLADVVRYLDTAPPPVIAFTESLPANCASPYTSSSVHDSTSPAFVFHMYLENISSQNALGHLAGLFGIPLRSFQTHTAASKMSCSTVICAIAENLVRREHLLLLNTLRHPGFVLRVSDIREVREDVHGPSDDSGSADASSPSPTSQRLFRELARWQPLYHTEVLLRRVCSAGSTASGSGLSTRQQLEHRLRAVQTVGAICFCANREASLARAATDVLHNFFRSALLNALQRRKAPVPLTRFLKRPNLATAQHAHHVSTDVTVRQVLKAFMQCNGDWHATVVRTPYVWRRRWINALRGLVWNTMASQRIRKAGREVCLGDVVLKPEYRDDVHRRGIMTVKAEHVMVVTTSAEAQAACMEDVFIPFLRGRYPEHLFADESTGHPIMTRTNMLALLRAMHAPQLLLGFTDEVRLLLDIRADVSPLLFRRLLVRPLELEFAILEDKPPMRALHFDAARLLTNDRWLAADGVKQQQPSSRTGLNDDNGSSGNARRPAALQLTRASHLIPPSVVLERTTLGTRLASGILSEEFFSVPSADDYVVLGHAHRHLDGDLVQAAPHSDTAVVGDRVYSVYIRAVVEHNLAGLSSMLREYFVLSGIETEADSSLQHKVHRMRRELDPETELLTAPVYCSTCYNRDHDTQEQCAEYQYKRHRRGAQLDLAAAALQLEEDAHMRGMEHERGAALPPAGMPEKRRGNLGRDEVSVTGPAASMPPAASTAATTPVPARTVCMRWRLRRRHDEQRWGVRLTKSLHLVGIDDASLLREAAVWCSATSEACDAVSSASTTAAAMPDEAEVCPWPSSWIAQSAPVDEQAPPSSSSALRILEFLRAALRGSVDTDTDTNTASQQLAALTELLAQSPLVRLQPAALAVALPPSAAAPAASQVKACKWRLAKVNAKPVATQRDVAAAMLTEAGKSREVWLTFEVPIGAAAENRSADVSTRVQPGASDSPGALTKRDDAGSIASRGVVPQSTAAMPPQRRHETEAAMRRALRKVSPDTRRWVQDLPYRVTIVLKKDRRQVQAHRSWGLQLDGTDMTLVNFAKLMLRFMADSGTHDKQGHGGGRCSVASIAPGEAFPRLSSSSSDKNDHHLHSTSKLLSDLDPILMPVLNDMYHVVRIRNTPVRHKAEAARAMADFQALLDAALASADVAEPSAPPRGGGHRDAHANMSASNEEFFLTLTLERKASSYQLCNSPATEQGLKPAAAELSDRGDAPVSANGSLSAAALSAPAAAAVVDAALLSGLATERCPVRPITEVQLSRSVVTVAINRLLLTSATMDKWGLRLQQGTRRLKAIQENQYFSFHVFADKKSQGTRIADTLRLIPASNAATGAATRRDASTSAARRAHHLYYVERVNRTAVRSHAELRQALLTAAQPAQQQQQELGRGLTPIPALPPESVTLGVRQFPLLRLSATVRRGGVGEESALGPVGLQVDNRMQVVAVFAGSPMARALDEAAGPICSLRRLIRDRSDARGVLDSTPEVGSEAAWDVVRDPQLRESLARLVAATSVPPSSSAGSSAGSGTDEPRSAGTVTTVVKKPVRRQWNYGMDEDDGENSGGGNDAPDARVAAAATGTSPGAPAVPVSAPSLPLVEEESAVRAALRDLAAVAAYIQQQLCKCTMVDGVHMLQASMLQEFALAQLAKLDQHHGPSSDGAPSSEEAAAMLAAVRTELAQLHERVVSVHHEVRWEVVYAVASNRPLRTPADLAAAFAPGVAEETIILQQLMED
ncbi:tRNA pseudouridine synthase [Leishmania donovani]|nr:tRNA pseudouridine synthase [Leishmania donovani]